MDFYYGRMSGNSTRVAFCLAEIGVDYTPRFLDTRQGENREPHYLALNPMGKIPTLVDGSAILWESNAINWYLAEKFPQAHLLSDKVDDRAEALRWLFFQVAHVSPACIAVYRVTNAKVQAFWGLGEARAAEAAMRDLARFLPVIDQRLDNRSWLAGDFSLADIAYAPHLLFIAEGGFDFSPYPRLRAWLDRLLARPAWQTAAKLILT